MDTIFTMQSGEDMWMSLPLWARARNWAGAEVTFLGVEEVVHGVEIEGILVGKSGEEEEKGGIELWGQLETLLHVVCKMGGRIPRFDEL